MHCNSKLLIAGPAKQCLRKKLKPGGKVKRSIIGDQIAEKFRFQVEKDTDLMLMLSFKVTF